MIVRVKCEIKFHPSLRKSAQWEMTSGSEIKINQKSGKIKDKNTNDIQSKCDIKSHPSLTKCAQQVIIIIIIIIIIINITSHYDDDHIKTHPSLTKFAQQVIGDLVKISDLVKGKVGDISTTKNQTLSKIKNKSKTHPSLTKFAQQVMTSAERTASALW